MWARIKFKILLSGGLLVLALASAAALQFFSPGAVCRMEDLTQVSRRYNLFPAGPACGYRHGQMGRIDL